MINVVDVNVYKIFTLCILVVITLLPLVLRALNKAFSAPRICTVEAGYLARLVSDPAWEISRAPTVSPINVAKLGATDAILSWR